MPDVARDSQVVELDGSPRFVHGEKVASRFMVRNDGTFRGKDIGEVLVHKGDVGYITSIGTFLQQFYIYGVLFIERGYSVGMKGRELRSLDAPPAPVALENPSAEGIAMKVMIRRTSAGQLSAYVAKKDLEEPIVAQERPELWGGQITLANGWRLELPTLTPEPKLPITVEARKVSD